MIERIGPNKWLVTASNKDRYGKQTRRRRRVMGSEATARREKKVLDGELAAIRLGFEYYHVKYCEFLEKEFFRHVDQNSPAEYDGLTKSMRKWCRSIWGFDLNAIHQKDIQTVLDEMGESCVESTVRKMKSFLNRSFELAMEGGLRNNPVTRTKVKQKSCKEYQPAVLNREEIRILLAQAKILKPDWYHIWAISVLTGLRIGELLALLRQDVDLDQKMISVNKSWNKKVGVKSTKTGRWRKVPIADKLIPVLQPLLMGPKGEPVIERNYILDKGDQARVIRQFCQGIGITSIKHHDLRATFITQLFASGASIAEVQSIVGHVDLKTTQRYLRLAGVDVAGVTNKLDFVLPSERVNNVVNLFK
jgi:integrase